MLNDVITSDFVDQNINITKSNINITNNKKNDFQDQVQTSPLMPNLNPFIFFNQKCNSVENGSKKKCNSVIFQSLKMDNLQV